MRGAAHVKQLLISSPLQVRQDEWQQVVPLSSKGETQVKQLVLRVPLQI